MYDISTLPFHSRHRKSSMVIRRIEINVSDVYSPDSGGNNWIKEVICI